MNKRERDLLVRVYSLVEQVPFPASGTRTTTLSGQSGYSEDMRQFQPALRQAIFALVADGLPHMIEDEDYERPESIISAMEAWVEQRKRDQWNQRSLFFPSFYEHWKAEQEGGDTQ